MRRLPLGKAVGLALGLAFGGGIPSAVFGFLIGHAYDRRRDYMVNQAWSQLEDHDQQFEGSSQQAAFTMGVIVLGAKMAKADGRVNREEIEAFKRVFNVRPEQESYVGKLFNQARRSAYGYEPYALQIENIFRTNRNVLEEVLTGLFLIAASDSPNLSQEELTYLRSVAVIFKFSARDFFRIAARSGIPLEDPEKPKNPNLEFYAILGLHENATPENIKATYRKLIREHHPDKLVAQGMPSEMVATATEKMKRINVAYDNICKLRNIK